MVCAPSQPLCATPLQPCGAPYLPGPWPLLGLCAVWPPPHFCGAACQLTCWPADSCEMTHSPHLFLLTCTPSRPVRTQGAYACFASAGAHLGADCSLGMRGSILGLHVQQVGGQCMAVNMAPPVDQSGTDVVPSCRGVRLASLLVGSLGHSLRSSSRLGLLGWLALHTALTSVALWAPLSE